MRERLLRIIHRESQQAAGESVLPFGEPMSIEGGLDFTVKNSGFPGILHVTTKPGQKGINLSMESGFFDQESVQKVLKQLDTDEDDLWVFLIPTQRLEKINTMSDEESSALQNEGPGSERKLYKYLDREWDEQYARHNAFALHSEQFASSGLPGGASLREKKIKNKDGKIIEIIPGETIYIEEPVTVVIIGKNRSNAIFTAELNPKEKTAKLCVRQAELVWSSKYKEEGVSLHKLTDTAPGGVVVSQYPESRHGFNNLVLPEVDGIFFPPNPDYSYIPKKADIHFVLKNIGGTIFMLIPVEKPERMTDDEYGPRFVVHRGIEKEEEKEEKQFWPNFTTDTPNTCLIRVPITEEGNYTIYNPGGKRLVGLTITKMDDGGLRLTHVVGTEKTSAERIPDGKGSRINDSSGLHYVRARAAQEGYLKNKEYFDGVLAEKSYSIPDGQKNDKRVRQLFEIIRQYGKPEEDFVSHEQVANLLSKLFDPKISDTISDEDYTKLIKAIGQQLAKGKTLENAAKDAVEVLHSQEAADEITKQLKDLENDRKQLEQSREEMRSPVERMLSSSNSSFEESPKTKTESDPLPTLFA